LPARPSEPTRRAHGSVRPTLLASFCFGFVVVRDRSFFRRRLRLAGLRSRCALDRLRLDLVSELDSAALVGRLLLEQLDLVRRSCNRLVFGVALLCLHLGRLLLGYGGILGRLLLGYGGIVGRAFGGLLVYKPLMQNVLADLAVEAEAATALAMRLAHAVDAGERDLLRLAVAVGKYWVCKRAPAVVGEALECLGGNGYVEDSGLPRLYREAPLNSIWEGAGNVNALDVLRALAREPAAVEALRAEVSLARGCGPPARRGGRPARQGARGG